MGIDAGVAGDALFAFDTAWAADEADHFGYGVTDFSLPSDQRRLWILDLAAGSLRHHLYVSHGEMSSDPNDSRWATSFSNVEGSHQSSLGVMQGAESYTGSFGYSMRMDGLEPGYNDNVRDRAIVVHPWDGSTDAYVSNVGESAPTWGCAGLDPALCTDVVDFLAFGGLLLFHYPDGDWSQHSAYLP
ncbi:MAG: murein L,D-transpeptidase catalytic domain family protein [Deltaproteobacteria bacterium]|nr:murein L,D-transpeptidase catalytic domain family protein [Deltaproteobacteria bacterium]